MRIFNALVFALAIGATGTAVAQTHFAQNHFAQTQQVQPKVPTDSALLDAVQFANETAAAQFSPSFMPAAEGTLVPYAEYQKAGYLLFSDSYPFDSFRVKKELAKNLPQGVQLVIVTGSRSSSNKQSIIDDFKDVIDESRITVLYVPDGRNGFWSRDSFPIPVMRYNASGQKSLEVVDAKYLPALSVERAELLAAGERSGFDSDNYIAELIGAPMVKHDFFYEGGNFMGNDRGECIIVNNRLISSVPDSAFLQYYGCRKLTRLPHTTGIGHIDETVRFVDHDTVLSDDATHTRLLREAGYEVIVLPKAPRYYETYANALVIEGVVYLPVYDTPLDAEAIRIYESLGYKKVIPINTESLSNDGLGSIHCITMVYPKMALKKVAEKINAEILK